MANLNRLWLTLAVTFAIANFAVIATASPPVPLADFPASQTQETFSLSMSLQRRPPVGVVPVEVIVQPRAAKFLRERTLTIEIRPRCNPLPGNGFDFRQDITLPQNAASFKTTLEVPSYYRWGGCRVRVLEDGNLLPGFDTGSNSTFANAGHTHDLLFGVLVPRGHNFGGGPWACYPDCRSLHAALGFAFVNAGDANSQKLNSLESEAFNRSVVNSRVAVRDFAEDELSDRWATYRDLDVLLASVKAIRRVHKESPPKIEAIRQWLACGGCLWVFGDESPSELDQVLGIDQPWQMPAPNDIISTVEARFANGNSSIRSSLERAGQQAVASLRSLAPQNHVFQERLIVDENNISGHWFEAVDLDENGTVSEKEYGNDQLVPWAEIALQDFSGDGKLQLQEAITYELRKRFRQVDYLAGKVLHIAGDPFPGSPDLWYAAYGLSSSQTRMENRLGLDIQEGDNAYWDWMIGEVGTPPVFTFLTLISLFVLLVGPVSYYTFLHIKRLYLFFVFAPVMAIICSLAIGAYALLGDGFGTRVRIRQVTLLNDNGDGSVWYRQTYFAGLRPANGARWDHNKVVIPIRQQEENLKANPNGMSFEASGSTITADDDGVQFEGQFMPSRKQAQFAIVHPAANLGNIEVTMSQEKVVCKNNTRYDISRIMLADGDGDNWVADAIPAGGQVEIDFMDRGPANKWLRMLYVEKAMEPPPGYQETSQGGLLAIGNRRRRRSQREFFTVNDAGIGESAVRYRLMDRASLDRGTFIAVANVDEDSIGVRGAVPVECTHFLFGTARFQGTKPAVNRAPQEEIAQ